jgi:hypothetical protein
VKYCAAPVRWGRFGEVAQMVERRPCKAEATGSTPVFSRGHDEGPAKSGNDLPDVNVDARLRKPARGEGSPTDARKVSTR